MFLTGCPVVYRLEAGVLDDVGVIVLSFRVSFRIDMSVLLAVPG